MTGVTTMETVAVAEFSKPSLARNVKLSAPKKFGFYERPPLETPDSERLPSGLYRNGKLRVEPEAVDESLVRETARALDQAHDALFSDDIAKN